MVKEKSDSVCYVFDLLNAAMHPWYLLESGSLGWRKCITRLRPTKFEKTGKKKTTTGSRHGVIPLVHMGASTGVNKHCLMNEHLLTVSPSWKTAFSLQVSS